MNSERHVDTAKAAGADVGVVAPSSPAAAANEVARGQASRNRPTPETGTAHYLPFVDGLRAISILAVVGCHLGLPGFSGGYVGVDVFFVISGFLIVNQIRGDLESRKFSFLSFYARRTLRIQPPFLIVLLAVYCAAPFILPTPTVYFDFGLSAALSPVMLTNILFFRRQGYFDISAIEKPFLHTWSLSVEEQFYVVAPLLLLLVFQLGGRRFGKAAAIIGIALAAVSLAGAIVRTPDSGANAAFYLTHWRIWEFIFGGFIGGSAVLAVSRWPRAVLDAIGVLGLACIVLAIVWLDSATPYPSWRAVLPAGGAALVILSGLVRDRTIVARLLAMRGMVAIGLVSYGWYLWHWPILSLMRISRLGEASLWSDVLGGGVLAFLLACASYRYVELPIRRWRRSHGRIQRPGKIFAVGAAAAVACFAIGGLSSLGGYLWIKSYVASVYGVEGKGGLDNGCRVIIASDIPSHCLEGKFGLLVGDSHAEAMNGSFARSFDSEGFRLVYMGRGGCDPIHFATSERQNNRARHCANLLKPFEQVLAGPPPAFVIITPGWTNPGENRLNLWSELVSQFDSSQTRIALIAPVPTFKASSLDCVVLSDRYRPDRRQCVRPRSEVEADRAAIVATLRATAKRFGNVRLIDPIDLFCDARLCEPFKGDRVFYKDSTHVLTQGADLIHDRFESDFRWLTRSD